MAGTVQPGQRGMIHYNSGMRHRVWAIWATLIAVLLATPPFAERRLDTESWRAYSAADAPALPSARPADPVARSLAALKSKSSLVRQWAPPTLAVGCRSTLEVLTCSASLADLAPRVVHPADSAGDFTPFPTGPPPES